MSSAVGDIGDEIHVPALLAAEETVDGVDEHLDDVDVLPLVEAANVVGVGYLALMEDDVDGTGMILNVEPVAHVLTLTIDGQRLTVADVVDEQRNQFLGELVGTIVVGAIGDDDRHAVGVVEGTHEVVA